jgi:hypothetical protein
VLTLTTVTAAAQQPMPRTTKEQIKGAPMVSTEKLQGTVVLVDGNHLLVRMSSGDLRTFDVPESRRFIVDGRELSVHELKPGTALTATVTTTATPVTDRTTTVGTGKVWHVSGNTVIITLPNNENRMYKVDNNYRFNVEGKEASVHELRKGMVISAQKIVEEPRTVIASDTVVVGKAPPPPQPPKTVAQAPVPERPAPAPAPARPEPAAAPAEPTADRLPATLPKTGSPLPLAGTLGVVFIIASLGSRRLRRS